MAKLRVLGDRFIQDMKNTKEEVANRVRGPRTGPPPTDDWMPPEVYVAAVPVGGIPARVGTTLGSAECVLYKMVEGVLEAMDGASRTVYNLSAGAIDAGVGYVTVKRDKWGTWLAEPVAQVFSGVKVTPFNGPNNSITLGTPYKVPFDGVDYDTDNYWSSGHPTRITFPSLGRYLVGFHCNLGCSHPTLLNAAFVINGDGSNGVPGSDMGLGIDLVPDDLSGLNQYFSHTMPIAVEQFGISYIELQLLVTSTNAPSQPAVRTIEAYIWAFKMSGPTSAGGGTISSADLAGMLQALGGISGTF
jgi:hypothetical protein